MSQDHDLADRVETLEDRMERIETFILTLRGASEVIVSPTVDELPVDAEQ